MTTQEYLSQVYKIDLRIKCKIEQVKDLYCLQGQMDDLGVRVQTSPDPDKMARTVSKIILLKDEIQKDVDRLIDLKAEVVRAIKAVDNVEHQMLLEMRYLNGMRWEQIALDLGYSMRGIFALHKKALNSIKIEIVQ